ncbi:MAG: Imm26 family immunity protein [Spirosomataceae bacterium]
MKRPIVKSGLIVKIPLSEGYHTYARILDKKDFAFYKIKTKTEVTLDEIIASEIIFTGIVELWAITKLRWEVLGYRELESNIQNWPKYFIPDIVDRENYRIFEQGGIRDFNVTKEECNGLEYGIVWSPEGMEERINDFFEGRQNEHINFLNKFYYAPPES